MHIKDPIKSSLYLMGFSTGMRYLQYQIQHKKLEWIRRKLHWKAQEIEHVPLKRASWCNLVQISVPFNTINGPAQRNGFTILS